MLFAFTCNKSLGDLKIISYYLYGGSVKWLARRRGRSGHYAVFWVTAVLVTIEKQEWTGGSIPFSGYTNSGDVKWPPETDLLIPLCRRLWPQALLSTLMPGYSQQRGCKWKVQKQQLMGSVLWMTPQGKEWGERTRPNWRKKGEACWLVHCYLWYQQEIAGGCCPGI